MKADSLTVTQRILDVEKALLLCKTRRDIVEYVRKTYNIRRAQADQYIRVAQRRLKQRYREQANMNVQWHIEARRALIDQATHVGDIRQAHAILKDIAELQGLYEIAKERPAEKEAQGVIILPERELIEHINEQKTLESDTTDRATA